MGKKKVSPGRSKKLPDKVEVRRGIIVVELTRKGRKFFDSKGREYEAVERSDGSLAYDLKKAHLVTNKVLRGVCDKNPKHRIHTDVMPRSKKCDCGGTYRFEDLMKLEKDAPEGREASQAKSKPKTKVRTPSKRKDKSKR